MVQIIKAASFLDILFSDRLRWHTDDRQRKTQKKRDVFLGPFSLNREKNRLQP